MNLEAKIKFILDKKNKTVKWLAQSIEMSEQNFYKIFKRNSIETSHLQKIAEVLEVPITTFFEEENKNGSNINYQVIKGDNNNQNSLKDRLTYENESLRREIESQKKEIALLREMIEMLKKK